jgi:hypothetical protein
MRGVTTGNVSCLQTSSSGQLVFDWLTTGGGEDRSIVTVNSTNSGLVGAVLAGTVTDGLFAGDTVTATFAANPLQFVGCVTPQGATQFSGTAGSVFTHL